MFDHHTPASFDRPSAQVFRKEGALYAFKGLAGRLGPIGVHAALILSLGGTAYSGVAGWKGAVMVPEGQGFLVAERIRPASSISSVGGGKEGCSKEGKVGRQGGRAGDSD